MLEFRFIGWCNEGKHDKVWGVIQLGSRKCLTFWGRRGKKLQTKETIDDWDLTKLIISKEIKGYVSVDQHKLHQVYPEFQEDLEKTAIWAILSN